MLIFQVLANFF